MDRLAKFGAQFKKQQSGSDESRLGQVGVKNDDDIVIIKAVRTPICKARKGGFASVKGEDLLASVLSAILTTTKISPKHIKDIAVGNVLSKGCGATAARMAALSVGIPDTCSVMSVNRQCSSGLQAVANIANAIKAGQIDVGIGAGYESMTFDYGPQALNVDISDNLMRNEQSSNCLLPMGITSENVAEQFGVTREEQDKFAILSHQKAASASFPEIVPVTIAASGKIVDCDDGIRKGISVQALSKLNPVFRDNGTTTAGNSSQVSDGAGAVLLMSRKRARELGLAIEARFLDYCTVGVAPGIMGIGPSVAIPELLSKNKLSTNQIAIFEINEAFASQALYCARKLSIPPHKLNPKGGAIAFGHPLGATGARMVATIVPQLGSGDLGVVSMCMGTGMGAAALIERE